MALGVVLIEMWGLLIIAPFFRSSSVGISISFLASSWRQLFVCRSEGKLWAGTGRAGEVLQPPAQWELNDHGPPEWGWSCFPVQPAQGMTSSAQTVAEVGDQVRAADDIPAEEHHRSRGGQQPWDRLPQASSTSRAHPTGSLPALPSRDAWLHSQDPD